MERGFLSNNMYSIQSSGGITEGRLEGTELQVLIMRSLNMNKLIYLNLDSSCIP
jgi:hypothetical protein